MILNGLRCSERLRRRIGTRPAIGEILPVGEKLLVLSFFLSVLLLCGVARAGDGCPASGSSCSVTLSGPKAPSVSGSCTSFADLVRFLQPEKWSDGNRDGVFETVLELALDPTRNCACARFRVHFDATPSGFAVHFGNSPTNDGYGGDQGTTPNSAELQILARKLTVFTGSREPTSRQLDKLLEVELPPLEGRVAEIQICEQSLAFELVPTDKDRDPRRWRLETLNAGLLFSLGPSGTSGRDETRRPSLYAAFNRVVRVTTGAAAHDRLGKGVRKVELSLSP